jgi:hypothetical protein
VLPRVANQELDPLEVAARLVDGLRGQSRPEPRSAGRVTNVVSGNVSGTVIQAGDIHGGLHF